MKINTANSISPHFCYTCKHGVKTESGIHCQHARTCKKWTSWFKNQWGGIRESAREKGLLKDED